MGVGKIVAERSRGIEHRTWTDDEIYPPGPVGGNFSDGIKNIRRKPGKVLAAINHRRCGRFARGETTRSTSVRSGESPAWQFRASRAQCQSKSRGKWIREKLLFRSGAASTHFRFGQELISQRQHVRVTSAQTSKYKWRTKEESRLCFRFEWSLHVTQASGAEAVLFRRFCLVLTTHHVHAL